MPGLWLRSLSGRFLMVVALLLVTFSVTMTALSAHQEATALYGELERTARNGPAAGTVGDQLGAAR